MSITQPVGGGGGRGAKMFEVTKVRNIRGKITVDKKHSGERHLNRSSIRPSFI